MAGAQTTVIIGASAAGLACARCLQEKGIETTILEQHADIAHPWRHHYERLHLHTPKQSSALPYLKMPRSFPKFPGRQQVIDYLERYAATLIRKPLFGERVSEIRQDGADWLTVTGAGSHHSRNVIVATGYTRQPVIPDWKGRTDFRGRVVHTSEYRNGEPYRGKKVLVVGFGNSACEIAISLHEAGALPSMSVRSAVNVIPRDILGIPILTLGILESPLPSRLADLLNAPVMQLTIGDITRYGLRKLPYGPMTQIWQHHQIPLLDIGTMRLIRQGAVKIFPGISEFTATGVTFADGRDAAFDAVILGTGYRPAVNDFLKGVDSVLDEAGVPRTSGRASSASGLYFCGFHIVPSGGLREIGIEARRIAGLIGASG